MHPNEVVFYSRLELLFGPEGMRSLAHGSKCLDVNQIHTKILKICTRISMQVVKQTFYNMFLFSYKPRHKYVETRYFQVSLICRFELSDLQKHTTQTGVREFSILSLFFVFLHHYLSF